MGKVAVGAAVVCAAAVCAAAALVVRHRMISSRKWARGLAIVKEFEEKCGTPIGKLRQLADAMDVEMHAGLASEGGSKLSMLISYVDNLPTGFVDLSFIYPLSLFKFLILIFYYLFEI
jgi:hexokinase